MEKGNFIEQMFIYRALRKMDNSMQKYGGIHEVVQGSFSQNRADKKYETHIEKLLAWTIKNKDKKEISHFSLQGHFTYLSKQKRNIRTEELDDRYYPFVLEFESSNKAKEIDVYYEVAEYIQHLLKDYNIEENDIVITITNSKSVYVWVNPKIFGLKPSKNVHRIYTEMYKHFKQELGLKYVDESVVNSSYRLIKTPGSFYNGGFVNYITLQELLYLMTGELNRSELTKNQRDIRDLSLPGVKSLKLVELYEKSRKKISKLKKENKKVLELPGNENRECVRALLNMPIVEKGNRNNFLVTIALGLLQENYGEDEILAILKDKAIEWKHDESLNAVVGKYKSLVRNKTKFSCDKVKMLFEEEGLTLNCNVCKKAINSIYIARNIIETIYENKGAVRHYKAYLELEKNNYLNRYFDLADTNIKETTLKELAKKVNGKIEKKDGFFKLNVKRLKPLYKLPLSYIENAVNILDQKIGKVLMLMVKAYNSNPYGAFISLGIEKISEYLCFKNERSVYKFLKELENIGFLTKNKKGITLYYKSRKVIDLNEERNNRKEQLKTIEEVKVVNGTQLELEFEKIKINTNNQNRNFKISIFNRIENKSQNKGSPP